MGKSQERLRDTFVVKESVRRVMKANRAQNTRPELLLRKELWAQGFRGYRKNLRSLPGRPDIVYTRKRVAIFVHGCFWHACATCQKGRVPSTNETFWRSKLQANVQRDSLKEAKLRELGFTVVTIWECEIRKDLDTVIGRLSNFLGQACP